MAASGQTMDIEVPGPLDDGLEQDDDGMPAEEEDAPLLSQMNGSDDLLSPRGQTGGSGGGCCAVGSQPFKWLALFLISWFTFGTCVAYDSVGALGPTMRRELHITAGGLADLYSVYHLPNIVLVFFGGALADRVGARPALLLFGGLVVGGMGVVATSKGVVGLAIGRFVFGCGSESLGVVQLGVLGDWFRSSLSPSLGLSYALGTTINRAGTIFAFNVLPAIGESAHGGLALALWITFLVCCTSLGAVVAFVFMDRARAKYLPARPEGGTTTATAAAGEEASFSIFEFSPIYWITVSISICTYATLVSFNDFSADLFVESYGFSPEKAATIESVSIAMSMVFTPVFGAIGDRYGHRITLMMIGSALLIPAHTSIALFHLNPLLSVVMQGLASATVLSCVWPAITLVVAEHRINKAIGLAMALQNGALFTTPLFVGWLRDSTGSFTAGLLLLTAIDGLIIALCVRLWQLDAANGRFNVLQRSAADIREHIKHSKKY